MKIVEFYEENGQSRNFWQAGAGATQKWTGSATPVFSLQDNFYVKMVF
jgi:hypothetical protein